MSIRTWTFFDASTGLLSGRTYSSGSDRDLDANTPEGYLPIEGEYDHLSQRVDVAATQPVLEDRDVEPSLEVEPLFRLPVIAERQPPQPWCPPVIDYQPPAPADTDLQTWAWDANTRRWQPVPTLAALQLAKWQEVKRQRSAAEFGGVQWDGSTFDSDETSQRRIGGAVQLATLALAAQQEFSIAWTLADNTVRVLSGADMIAVGLALGAHVAAQHQRARVLRAAIDAATSADELAAIQW
jgi:hypothetical protein